MCRNVEYYGEFVVAAEFSVIVLKLDNVLKVSEVAVGRLSPERDLVFVESETTSLLCSSDNLAPQLQSGQYSQLQIRANLLVRRFPGSSESPLCRESTSLESVLL